MALAWVAAIVQVWANHDYPRPFIDGLIYWQAWHGPMYAGDFIYPPPGALLFLPAAWLPPGLFLALYLVPSVAAAAWLIWPVRLALRMPLMVLLMTSLLSGQIAVLLAVALVFVPRYPILWTLLAWTKVAPAIGILSLVAQRRWRALLLVLNACALIGLAGFLVAPGLMLEWIAKVQASGGLAVIRVSSYAIYPPMWLRIALGAGIAYFGASRPWTLPVAATLVTPDLTPATVPLLAAVPRLRDQLRERARVGRQLDRADAGGELVGVVVEV